MFNYEIEKIQSPLRETLSKETLLDTYSSHNISPVLGPTHENHGANKSLTSGWRLLNIVWKDNILSFSHENREDICRYSTADSIPQRITGIKVINKDSRLIKDLRFQQSYFSDGSFHHHPHLFKRLRLDGITDILSDSCRYQFSYYGYALVPKNTHNTDYWGFPNGSQQLENYLCSVSYNGSQYLGGNKTPNLDKTLDGTLRSITHPTGGQTKFEYELNTYMEYEHVNDDNPTPEVTEDGYLETYQGAWCEEFCHLPEVAEDTIVITYQQDLHMNFGFCYGFENRDTPITDYSHDVAFSILKLHENGNKSFVWQREIPEEILTQEVFYKDTVISRIPEGTYIIKVQATMPDFECDLTYGFHKRVPLYARSPRQVNGGGLRIAKISGQKTVEYNYLGPVQTIKPITSYIRQAFYFNATVDDAYASANYLFQFSESIRPLSTIKNGNTFGYGQVTETISDGTNTTYNFHNDHENELELGFPLLPTVPDWYNGLIESKTVSSPQGASLRTDYEYEQRLAPKPMQGMVYQPHDIMHSYSYEVYYPFEVRRTETEQFQNITTYSHVVHTSYNENLLPISVKDIAGGEEYETITVYPTDDNANISMNENMLSCNMVAVPVETRQLRNQVLINGQRTEYMQTADNLIVPQYKYSFSSGLPLGYDTIFYSCYTPKGHPRQLNLHNSVQTILWDQSDTYPIAVLQNQPFSAGISADQPRLRESFPEAHITTSSYIPLVGVTDKVNPRGYKQTFTYDRAGRFNGSFYKDDSGTDCAVQSIRYHYSDAIDPQNYVSTTTYIEKDRSDSLMKVEFFDGFSRPTTTSVQGLTMDGSYLSSLVQYDANGRKARSWLPISSDEASAIDSASMRSLSSSFYNDGAAYEDIAYDGLDRTTYTSTPGEAWLDKGSHIYYGTNGYQEVRSFKVENGQLHSHNYFQAGTLRKKTMRDDDGVEVSSFSNLADKVIMQQKQDQCTYFVYDAHDNLRLVLSPVASDSLSRNGNWPIATNTILNRYCYYYEYDQRNRCIKKKLPGCAPVIYEYDNANHLVSEQDGVLSAKRKKRHYRYDSFDRMTEQYLSSDNGQDNYTEIRQWYDGYNFLDSLSAYFSSDILDSLSYEGITNAKGLLTGKLQRTSDDSWFADIFFYDELGRIKRHQTLHDGRSIQSSKMEYNNIGDVKREQVTYNVINPGTNLTIDKTYQYYPQSQKLWHKNAVIHTQTGTDSVTQTFSYDCLGNLAHTDRDGDAADMDYQYDMVHGWLKQIDSQNGFQQKLHREEGATIPRFNGSISAMEWKVPRDRTSRKYNYEYDSTNRLSKAKYSEMPGMPTPGVGDFGSNSSSNNQGNVSLLSLVPSPQAGVIIPGGNVSGADYYTEEIQYDKNSNIRSLQRHGRNNRGTYGLIDDLVIEYVGNQRTKVTDNAPALSYDGSSDFVDVQDIDAIEYSYNANGSLTKDKNRRIDSIYYDNSGNLQRIRFCRVPNEGLTHTERENDVTYIYTTDGQKLNTSYQTTNFAGTYPLSMTAASTDYVGNLILKNGHPEMLRLDDGYVSFDSDTISGIHYYIQDYMGNNRVVVNRDGTIEQITHYYPYGGVIGDISTNESLQKFKFEGKELDRTFGLDNYDIHARQYFAMAPMWDRPDKLAEKYYGISPYVYCGGDPVNRGDFDGKKVIMVNGFSLFMLERGTKMYWNGSEVAKWAEQINNATSTQKIEYIDGSIGSHVFSGHGKSLSSKNRYNRGLRRGARDAPNIIDNLQRDENGVIIEPLVVMTHSMGAAFAKGYLESILEYAKDNGIEDLKVYEFDFAPHQPREQKAVKGVETFQISHDEDTVVSNSSLFFSEQGIIDGAIQVSHHWDSNQGHSLMDFIQSVKELRKMFAFWLE